MQSQLRIIKSYETMHSMIREINFLIENMNMIMKVDFQKFNEHKSDIHLYIERNV